MGEESELVGDGEEGDGDVDGLIDLLLMADFVGEFGMLVELVHVNVVDLHCVDDVELDECF